MALRRKLVLPSRMESEIASDSGAVAQASVPARKEPVKTPVAEASPPAAAVEVAAVPQVDVFAAAAAEAFGTVPEVAPKPRVLEESFVTPVVAEPVSQPAPVVAEPEFVAPAWQEPQASSEFVAPAWEAPAEPVAEPFAPEAVAPAWDMPTVAPGEIPAVTNFAPQEATPEVAPEVATESVPAWQMPVQAESPVVPEVQAVAAAVAEPVVTTQSSSAFAEEPTVADIPQAVTVMPDVPTPDVPTPDVTPAEESVPQGPTNFTFEASRPDNSRMKRRVREKRARDFSAMGSAEDAKAARPQPVTDAFAPTVPVDTRPLDEVDDALIASGVMAPRPGDSLTSSLPGGVAESTQRFEPAPLPASQPTPLPVEEEPQPRSEPQPIVHFQPQPLPTAPLPEPKPETAVPLPAFTLSNAAPQPAAEPLPAPQSDLPWVQPQVAAEWDIGAPQEQDWAQNAPETASEPAMHMPPQADLYKPMGGAMGTGTVPLPRSIPTPSAMPSFTPELPGQRRKAQGTPWALVAVGLLVVAAAGGYLMTSGKQGATAALTNLTNRTATGNEQQPLLPPPDGSTAGSGSFMAAEPMPAVPATDTSSSAMVAFADVPAGEASQPIVADGKEDMPKGFLAEFNDEVEKARARKEGGANATEDAIGATPAPVVAEGSYTQEDLKKELEAYRTALSSSANPAELKPGQFEAGKAGQTDAEMASGSLLPPPAALPPAEMYNNNPNNLPVVAEPVTNAPERVRTLADFPDVEAYMPEREKVEVPANIKPKLAATDFPALEILSFVPNQGVVAFADGREGVLLIGESINGWELVAVSADNAEFKAGQKSYQVTSQN